MSTITPPRLPEGASTVPTGAFTLAKVNADAAVRDADIAGFFGDAGTGKTYAVRTYCSATDIEVAYITATPSPGRKEIYEEILTELTGGFDGKMTGVQLRRECEALLAEKPRIVVIDECQYLSWMWHQQIRTLHDRDDAQWTWFLVGGTNARKVLQKDESLWRRITYRTNFSYLVGDELLNVLRAYHPVLANTDDKLLLAIDRKDCNGSLGEWDSVLRVALHLLPGAHKQDRLTPEVVRAVFAQRGIA